MSIKYDLSVMIKMFTAKSAKEFDSNIEAIDQLLKKTEQGLKTSYEHLEIAKEQNNEKNILTIEAYIKYLESSIDIYSTISDSYKELKANTTALHQEMDKAIMM